MTKLHIIFDGPPGPESGRFVEVENDAGASISAGEWSQLPNGFWELVIDPTRHVPIEPTGIPGKPPGEATYQEID